MLLMRFDMHAAAAAEAQLLLFRGWAPRPGGAEHVLKAVSRCKWPDYGLLLAVGGPDALCQQSSLALI